MKDLWRNSERVKGPRGFDRVCKAQADRVGVGDGQ